MKRFYTFLGISIATVLLIGGFLFLSILKELTKKDLPPQVSKNDGSTTPNIDIGKIKQVLDKDAIPAILEPRFLKASQAGIGSDEAILGIDLGNESKAYPINILNWHEIVNDNIGRTPILISYCPLCGTGLAFVREVKGKELVFGVSGKLYLDNLVMYDKQSESYWIQLLGKSISGPYRGTQLKTLPLIRTTLGEWTEVHPDSLVLSRETGFDRDYDQNPYLGYEESADIGISGGHNPDERIFGKDMVMGVSQNGADRAYPLRSFIDSNAINDFLGGKPVLVYFNVETFTGQAYSRLFRKEVLIFKDVPGSSMIADENTGSVWSPVSGSAVSGKLKGKKLESIPSVEAYWFAWRNFHPKTEIYATADE